MLRSLRRQGAAARRRHRGAARPRRADDHRPRARDQPLPARRSPTAAPPTRPEGCDDEPSPPRCRGFPEWLPAERIVEREVIDTVRRIFELHGFAAIETRAVEPLEQLLRKGEIDKEVYVLRRLHADADEADAGLGLHFDLTVPFARYVLRERRHARVPVPPLPDPEGLARRAARRRAATASSPRPTSTSSAATTLPFHHDVEVALVMAEALPRAAAARRCDPGQQPQARSRASTAALGVDRRRRGACARSTSSTRSAGRQVAALLGQRGRAHRRSRPQQCLELAAIRSDRRLASSSRCARSASSTSCSTRASPSSPRSSTAAPRCAATGSRSRPTCASPAASTTTPAPSSRPSWSATSPSARSARGGRYDALASDGRTTYPGVGISLGVTRLAGAAARRPRAADARAGRCRRAVLVARRRRGVARPSRGRSPPRCAPAASPREVAPQRRRSSASRSATPSGAASRSSGSPAPTAGTRSRTSAPASRSPPIPTTWTPPAEDLRPHGRA